MSNRVAVVLEHISEQLEEGNSEELLLVELIRQLLLINKNENALAGNKGIS